MNKLVSKNPILRFKLGKKILKFGGGDRFQLVGYTYFPGLRSTDSEYVFYDKDTGNLLTSDIPNITSVEGTVNRGNNYSRYGYSWNSEEYKPKKSSNINLNLDPNRVARKRDYGKGEVQYKLDNGIWYARWTNPNKANLGWYKVAEGSTGYNRNGDHNVLKNGKWVKIDETPVEKVASVKTTTPFYQFGKMGGWKRSIGEGIINDSDSLNMLKEMGMEGKSALEVQDEINKVFGSNAVKSDNRWGNLSRAGLQALYTRWKSLQPTTIETKPTITQPSITQTPEFLERLRQLFIKEETPEQLADRAIVNNVDNLQFKRNGNYNKSGIRDLIRSYGLRAYDFTGNLRKALRLYLNGLSDDTSLLTNGLEKFIVPYKQGGQLVSKDPIKRFKLKNFILVAQ